MTRNLRGCKYIQDMTWVEKLEARMPELPGLYWLVWVGFIALVVG